MKSTPLTYIGEYIGTFFFILTIFASEGNPFIIGGSLALVIYLLADRTGGHVNPAVSISMYMNGSLKNIDMFFYIVAQMLGGISAYYTYKLTR